MARGSYQGRRILTDLASLELKLVDGLKDAWLKIVRGGVSADDDKVMADYLSAISGATVPVALWQRYRRAMGWKIDAGEAWGRVDRARNDERLWSGMRQ